MKPTSKKSPEILLKLGKKNGGMPKGAWGTMTMDGQIIKIDPINDKVPGNLAKLAKKFFSARGGGGGGGGGLKYRLEIVEPEEGEDETEEAAAEEQDTGVSTVSDEGGAEAAESDDQKDALETRLAEMQDQIDVLQADTENVMFSALQDGRAAHKRAMEDGDNERGASTLDTLDGVLEDYAGLLAEKTPLQDRMNALTSAIERVKKGDNSAAADQIGSVAREFDYALAHYEWVGAATKLEIIEQLIDENGGSASEAPEDDPAETGSAASADTSGSATSTEGEGSASSESDTAETEGSGERKAAKAKRKTIISQIRERLQSVMADLK